MRAGLNFVESESGHKNRKYSLESTIGRKCLAGPRRPRSARGGPVFLVEHLEVVKNLMGIENAKRSTIQVSKSDENERKIR